MGSGFCSLAAGWDSPGGVTALPSRGAADRAAFFAQLERVRRLTLGAIARAKAEPAIPATEIDVDATTRGPRLAERLGLSPDEHGFLWFAVALAADPLLGPHAVALGGSDARRGATLALYAEVEGLPADRARALGLKLGPSHPLFRFALLEAVDGGNVPALSPLRAAHRLCRYLAGDDGVDDVVASAGGLVALPDPAVVSDDDERTCAILERILAAQDRSLVIVDGPDGVGRRTVLGRAAQAVGCAAVAVDVRGLATGAAVEAALRALRRECLLREALPVVVGVEDLVGDEPEATARRAALQRFLNDLEVTAALVTSGESVPLGSVHPVVRVSLPFPTAGGRRALWEAAVGSDAGPLEEIAARYRMGAGGIGAAARAACAAARARAGNLAARDLVEGVRATIGRRFGELARRVDVAQAWDDLVVPDDVREQIELVTARARHAYEVLETWGFASRFRGGGLAVLLSGPPGTGKTMAAGLLARALDLDVYQVDLSRVVSKWIGETEKNLSRIFDAADAGHALLLFDEADALFAKRTEVRGSHDRYANLEVSHLLSRIESFGGVAVLTTNLAASLDPALRRRLAAHIVFPKPGPEERRQLWRSLMTARAPVDTDVDYDELAAGFPDLTGGNIRNAVVSAAFLAAAERTPIRQRHLERAAWNEYRAMGRVCFTKGKES